MNNEKNKGTLYLLPSLLSSDAIHTLPPYVVELIRTLRYFFVENERSARRFFKTMDKAINIDEKSFSLMDKHSKPDIRQLKQWLQNGSDVGIVSEAGYPCIADPGYALVMAAHRMGARIIPLVGPNSMLLALAASGFKGQQFRFVGYLPVRQLERIRQLKALEKQVQQTGETQLFMETPYRNRAMLNDILRHCQPGTLLCIAADLTAETEFIQTRSIKEWKNQVPDIHKRPAIFLIGK